ncbi:DUF4105 domain-containing protein [Lutibacter sp. B1]|uniref:lipoprotein N-acyltransferase Lnb domain-containing protein n=1 Tax=Lutibacter sp. B1 TaxID=2725996 RepID=UPI0014568A21|nr:DUF4105 domain-containing protein [Lutibacter sp. B1]NLP58143.1 DUF4105 domain-containing protein [Lutibacter sp. B1]
MNKSIYIFILFLFTYFQTFAQHNLSNRASISVITCGPGEELYSAFGHSAFRVYDPLLGLDKIYNYGTFDFDAPNFYMNFAKGKLTYQLSTTSFDRFLYAYKYENRWVKAQVLNLTNVDVQAVFNYLERNALPQNRSYQYDFFYNNCATKIEDVIKTVLKNRVSFTNDHIKTTKSHRELIADYTDQHFKWGKFGIDLALGSVIDDEATKDDYKFLPDYIFEAFNNATITKGIHNEALVKNEGFILKTPKQVLDFSFLQPIIVFSIILLLIFFITYKNYKKNKRTKWLDFSLYFITGIIGVTVLLLWFASSHTATYKNFNFLWAFAPNLVISFYMFKNKLPSFITNYNKFLLILILVLLIIWVLKIQVFNIALIPILLALAVRYVFLISKIKRLSTPKK